MAVEGYGFLSFAKNCKLDNKLYVPKCFAILLSIGRLKKELNCYATFDTKRVILLDSSHQMMIGKGEMQNGLYTVNLHNTTTLTMANYIEEARMWHCSAGHPSNQIPRIMYPV